VVVVVVVVVDVRAAAAWRVVVGVAFGALGALLLQDDSTSAVKATGATSTIGKPGCRRDDRRARISASIAAVRVRFPGMITTSDIPYEADGRTMIGTLALPAGTERRPGVLVCHEGPGLDDHTRGRATLLAELGYVAFALDYHGDGKWIPDREQMMTRIGELHADPLRTRAIAGAGLDLLCAEPRTDTDRMAAIGYCFGGTLALELARGGADLKAVVGFHAGLRTARPEDARNIRGKVLALIGADDPMVDAAQRRAFEEEMTAGGVDWVLTVYGGAQHSFTRPRAETIDIPGVRYHEPTDRRSWRAMLDLFDEVLA
jgi:dienelactone hydrolase